MSLLATFSLDKPEGLAAQVQEALAEQVTALLRDRVAPRLIKRTQILIDEALRASPEWASLRGDSSKKDFQIGATLREHFGIADPLPVLENIARALRDSVVIEILGPYRE